MSKAAASARRRGRVTRRGPSTPDGIELAMEAEAHDGSADSPAQRVLRSQAALLQAQLRLIGLDTWERRLAVGLRVVIGIFGAGLLLLASVIVVGAARSSAVIVLLSPGPGAAEAARPCRRRPKLRRGARARTDMG